MRRSDITRLHWEDVDFKRRRVFVVSRKEHHTKNYESRVIPLNEFLYAALQKQRAYRDMKPYVFCFPDGKPFYRVDTSFHHAIRRVGIPHVRFHDLRHTFASWLVLGGMDIRTVQELLGHKDLRMTMRYAHLAPDHLRYAVTGWSPIGHQCPPKRKSRKAWEPLMIDIIERNGRRERI
jgi:integrase